MGDKIVRRNPNELAKEDLGVESLFLDLIEDARQNLWAGVRCPWSYSWDGTVLRIRLETRLHTTHLEKQWFSLGTLLEAMDTRAAGAGLEFDVEMGGRSPEALVKPLTSVSRVHLLAPAFGAGDRGRSDEKRPLSQSFRNAIRLAVEEPGMDVILVEDPREMASLGRLLHRFEDASLARVDQSVRSQALGFLMATGTTPLDYVRTGRAFERLRWTAGFHGFRIEVHTGIDRLVRHPRTRTGGEGKRRFHLGGQELARWVPHLQKIYPLLAFHLREGTLSRKNVPALSFPTTARAPATPSVPSDTQIKTIVEYARWAPSGDNVQPFTFEWNGKELLVQEEASRSQAFMNVANVASHMALGMCLSNIEIGANREGWAVRWEMGESGGPARITFEPGPIRSSPLGDAVPARTVDRRPYRPGSVSRRYARELTDTVENSWGIRFRLLNDSKRVGRMAHINGGFESFLFEHRASHTYFYRWLRRTDADARRTRDGLPVSTLGVSSLEALGLRVLVWWGLARLLNIPGITRLAAHRARRAYGQSAGFGIFTVPDRDPVSFVRAGWLWQRVWLKMTLDGWSLQPVVGNALMGLLCRDFKGEGLTPAQKNRFSVEENEIRQLISADAGETIACVFRMGRPDGPVSHRAPRRSLETILKINPRAEVPINGNGEPKAGKEIPVFPSIWDQPPPLPQTATLPPFAIPEMPQGGDPSKLFDYAAAYSRNIGLVQPEEQKRLGKGVVAIAGLGGVGGVHVTTLARLGIGRFHLADFDRFEIHNFNRQAGAAVNTIGREKVEVMAQQALNINPSAEVRRFSAGVTAGNVDAFLDGVDVVVDGLDFFVPEAREILYDAAERRKIPLVTAGPIGMSVAWLVFMPGRMRWRDYFRFDLAKTPVDKLILFALGLTPRATQMSYIDRKYVDLPGHRGPSLSLAVQLCAGVAAGEVLKLLLGRGHVAPAPHFHQFDIYRGRYVTGQLRWGNAGFLQRIKFLIARRWISPRKTAPGKQS